MFLDLGTLQLRCCLWRVRELSDSIKNILICVPKINEGLTGKGCRSEGISLAVILTGSKPRYAVLSPYIHIYIYNLCLYVLRKELRKEVIIRNQ